MNDTQTIRLTIIKSLIDSGGVATISDPDLVLERACTFEAYILKGQQLNEPVPDKKQPGAGTGQHKTVRKKS